MTGKSSLDECVCALNRLSVFQRHARVRGSANALVEGFPSQGRGVDGGTVAPGYKDPELKHTHTYTTRRVSPQENISSKWSGGQVLLYGKLREETY